MFLGFQDIFETKWGSDSTGGAMSIVTCAIRAAGEKDGIDGRDIELWGHYGLSSRPPKPDGDKVCQAITGDAGGRKIILWTRDGRAADAHGDLNEGDVALWSVGKNSIRVNADGSIAIHKQGAEFDAFFSIDKDDAIIIANKYGQMELGPNGFVVTTATGEQFVLGGGAASLVAPTVALQAGTIALGVGASVPILGMVNPFAPGSYVGIKPVLNIFV